MSRPWFDETLLGPTLVEVLGKKGDDYFFGRSVFEPGPPLERAFIGCAACGGSSGAPELQSGCKGRKFIIMIFSGGKMRNHSIGEAAKASGLSARTIRYYEQIGLIPRAPRTDGNGAAGVGSRVYSEDDVARLRFVKRAREVELSLKDVRSLVSVADASGCPSMHFSYREILRAHLRGLDTRINHLLVLRASVHSMFGEGRGAPAACCGWGACECLGSTAAGRRPARTPAVRA